MSILERVRASGQCAPSLIGGNPDADFETAALKVVDANGMSVVRLSVVSFVSAFPHLSNIVYPFVLISIVSVFRNNGPR